MPKRRKAAPNRQKRGVQIAIYGHGEHDQQFYGVNKSAAMKFLRHAAGEAPKVPYTHARRVQLAREKLRYLSLSSNVGNPDKKFQARPAADKKRANEWAKRTFASPTVGDKMIAMEATYETPRGIRTLKLGPHSLGNGSLTFRARDFLDEVRRNGGDLWAVVAEMFNAEYQAISPTPDYSPQGKPLEFRIVAGIAANFESAA